MADVPTGFGIEETDGGFILRHADHEIRMTKEEFFSLRAQLNLWTERIQSQFQTRTGEVKQIVSHPIAEVRVWPDAIQQNVLLILQLPSGTQTIFSLPIPVAQHLAVALPHVVGLMHPSPMT
jgi:hypothetical protein